MIVRPVTPSELLLRAGALLEAHETEHNLILGLATSLVRGTARPDPAPFAAVVEACGEAAGAALMTPPRPLVVTRMPAAGLKALLDYTVGAGLALPGVNGPAEVSEAFAWLWAARAGGTFRPGMACRLYHLTEVALPPASSGALREARRDDLGLLVRWRIGFMVDALGEREEGGKAGQAVERQLAERRLFLWEDGEPRAQACWNRPTPHGICVSGVYTPPEFRRRGYATAGVAALSRRLLAEGRRFVCLFTDLANPTSNSVYMKIGYRPVCDFAEYRFEPPG